MIPARSDAKAPAKDGLIQRVPAFPQDGAVAPDYGHTSVGGAPTRCKIAGRQVAYPDSGLRTPPAFLQAPRVGGGGHFTHPGTLSGGWGSSMGQSGRASCRDGESRARAKMQDNK